jgi:hypothetical protein
MHFFTYCLDGSHPECVNVAHDDELIAVLNKDTKQILLLRTLTTAEMTAVTSYAHRSLRFPKPNSRKSKMRRDSFVTFAERLLSLPDTRSMEPINAA